MSWYTVITDFEPLTLIRSTLFDTEYSAIEASFALLPDDIDVRNNNWTYADDAGTENSIVVTLDPAPTAYAEGEQVVFKMANDNTGPVVINVNGLGAKNLLSAVGASLAAGELLTDQIYEARYNGADFQLISSSSLSSSAAAGLASDLQPTVEVDKVTGTIERATSRHFITRESAAAATYTMEADETAEWKVGDRIIIYTDAGTDVTVSRAGTGAFSLPDGTTTTSMECTTAGRIEMLKLAAGDDNWKVMQQ